MSLEQKITDEVSSFLPVDLARIVASYCPRYLGYVRFSPKGMIPEPELSFRDGKVDVSINAGYNPIYQLPIPDTKWNRTQLGTDHTDELKFIWIFIDIVAERIALGSWINSLNRQDDDDLVAAEPADELRCSQVSEIVRSMGCRTKEYAPERDRFHSVLLRRYFPHNEDKVPANMIVCDAASIVTIVGSKFGVNGSSVWRIHSCCSRRLWATIVCRQNARSFLPRSIPLSVNDLVVSAMKIWFPDAETVECKHEQLMMWDCGDIQMKLCYTTMLLNTHTATLTITEQRKYHTPYRIDARFLADISNMCKGCVVLPSAHQLTSELMKSVLGITIMAGVCDEKEQYRFRVRSILSECDRIATARMLLPPR
jgi:hypothetical protein